MWCCVSRLRRPASLPEAQQKEQASLMQHIAEALVGAKDRLLIDELLKIILSDLPKATQVLKEFFVDCYSGIGQNVDNKRLKEFLKLQRNQFIQDIFDGVRERLGSLPIPAGGSGARTNLPRAGSAE